MLIVSAYYIIPSKQLHEFYMEHLKRFFEYIREPVVFFTDDATLLKIKPFAKSNINFIVKPFKSLGVFEQFPFDFWQRQIERDPELYHTWQLGAIWANKMYFLRDATKFQGDDWLVWVDAGCIRKDAWRPYIDTFTKRDTFQTPGVYMQLLKPLPSQAPKYYVYPDSYVAGAIIVAHRSKIDDYIDAYNSKLEEYDKAGVSGTMDQYIMASILDVPWIHGIVCDVNVPDEWFFFLATV